MNIQKLMKQAQQMQKDMKKVEEELENELIEASAGGGMVHVKLTGKREFQEIKIDPGAVSPDDVDMLEDMVLAAVNEGLRKAKQLEEDKLGGLTKGMQMPGMF